MDVTYTDRAKQRGKEFALLQEATKQLEKVVERSSAKVTAEWDRIEEEQGRPLYTLRLSDGTDSAQTQIKPEHLKIAPAVRSRLYQLWGDVLEARSDAQHRKVQELIAQLPEG